MSLRVSRNNSLRSFSAIGVLHGVWSPNNIGLVEVVPIALTQGREACGSSGDQREFPRGRSAPVSVDGAVGKKQLPEFTPIHRSPDVVEQKLDRGGALAEFSCCFQVVPGDPERAFQNIVRGFDHAGKTPDIPAPFLTAQSDVSSSA